MEGGYKSNHTVYVDIPQYQVQNINFNHLKYKISKIKTSVWYKKISDERILTALKQKAPLYVDGSDLTDNQ